MGAALLFPPGSGANSSAACNRTHHGPPRGVPPPGRGRALGNRKEFGGGGARLGRACAPPLRAWAPGLGGGAGARARKDLRAPQCGEAALGLAWLALA